MILRRLKEHLRKENWFAVILEFVVVVVGLFLAFQLDRWYEAQRIQSDQSVHLASLTEDFRENERRLVGSIQRAEEKTKAVIALRDEIRKSGPDSSVSELNGLVAKTTFLTAFHPVNTTYENLISGGALVDLPYPELKKELAEFYAQYELTALVQATQELQYVTIWQPYALSNLDYAASNRMISRFDDTTLRPFLNPELVLSAMKTKQFENMLTLQWEGGMDLTGLWTDLLERARRIQALLAEKNP